ncbi:hypothetical protein GH714_011317 [Hevea brasiliensis]|uniref:Uncharacterized protein n=1 Tax=Hevea brasiliensis TaxID=3981 RepID=A0A6A6L644_HEVBR|nr:hypothetical protein GH714_011317 [Hevea brasiliensis]
MEEEFEENEAKEESQVGEASDGNGNQISMIHDENQQIKLVGHDQPPSVGMYYASIDIIFDVYLSYARQKDFSVAKKSTSKGNGNERKYQTISCDRGRKSYVESISKRINCPARLSTILKNEDQRLTNVFWVHPQSIAAYEEFCDVVSVVTYILYKVLEKLRGVQEYDKARKEFIALIYDSLSPTMFERNWHEFVVKYNLESNE